MIITDYSFLVFPPAHYGMGKCLVLLHNHSEAHMHIKKGLELLSSYRMMPLMWPGMSLHIMEIMPYDIEVIIKRIDFTRKSHYTILSLFILLFKNNSLHELENGY